ncbi:MAG: type II toxin-antitoxin system VapC family toxin [Caulobacteraceae bacterium]
MPAATKPLKVADASAVAAILFGEPEAARMTSALENGRLHAPEIIDLELTSVLLKKVRRSPDERDRLLACFRLFGEFDIRRHPIDRTGVFILAERSGLSAYDASYLWLAQELRAELVTIDKRLGAAAG